MLTNLDVNFKKEKIKLKKKSGGTAIRKNEILPSATMWMELEGIMLSKISQRKTNII